MKKNNPLLRPLSEDEKDWLMDFLDEVSETYPDTFSLEKIDGLFCALIINPILAQPSEWMDILFEDDFDFESEQEAKKVFDLLFRHWNHLNQLIQNPPKSIQDEIYFPLIAEYDIDHSTHKLAEQWAIGFHIGLDYCLDKWDELNNDEENYALMIPFILLELGFKPDDEKVLTSEEREKFIALIPASVYSLFEYWHQKTQKYKVNKTGRNDPYPCGSGKKYKKCCASALSDTIH